MALIIGTILALFGLAVAIYPFVCQRFAGREVIPPEEEDGHREGGAQTSGADELASIYQAIRTLQLERQLGSIPEGLYREQLNGYRFQAAVILKSMDQPQDDGNDWALEEEIRLARFGLIEGASQSRTCPNCGRAVAAGVTYCPECSVDVSRLSPSTGAPTGDAESGH